MKRFSFSAAAAALVSAFDFDGEHERLSHLPPLVLPGMGMHRFQNTGGGPPVSQHRKRRRRIAAYTPSDQARAARRNRRA